MKLPVLPSPPAHTPESEIAALATELSRICRGEVRFNRHDRLLYATDASMYQVEPIGVVIPADIADAAAVVRWCGAARNGQGVAMLPRGGGTALAGQTTNHAIVVDFSARCRAIGEVLRIGEHSAVDVEPGVSIDVLNAELAARGTGLFFAPDPATTAQSCIGGNIGTNAAGARSIRYGRTSENVLAIDCALASGERLRLESGAGAADPLARELAAKVIDISRRHERLIRERFPKTLRQNAGYGLDRMLVQLDRGCDAGSLDLAQLLCGSEGTLAATLGARLKLHPVPRGKGLALLAFATLEAAIDAVTPILATGPSAVELVDDVVIEAARGNRECSPFVDAFPRAPGSDRDPAAVLYVEYHEASPEAVAARFDKLRGVVGAKGPARFLTSARDMADAWKLRKAGEPLLHGLPGPRKPLTFVEDNAVPVEHLARFVREFKKIVAAAGTRAAFWAHASVGVLHVRPMLNPHSEADLVLLRRIATEVADLARDCGGVMSGEHGDGRVRGPLLERFFGPELMGAFREVKAVFDPRNLLNPGNIVQPGPIESITERTRIAPEVGDLGRANRPVIPPVDTYYDYEDHEGFPHAVEACNGSGVCRKTLGGSMCPSFRGTRDERHSTRGRGNALRLAITGQTASATHREDTGGVIHAPDWLDPETARTLDLCLSCKACKTECPSNVDIARLKSEFVAQGRRAAGGSVPLGTWLTGHVRILNRLGSLMPGLANATTRLPLVRSLIGRVMKLHPSRRVPEFSRSLFARAGEFASGPIGQPGTHGSTPPRVALFGDCFTAHCESDLGVAAGRVLTRLGYSVVLPPGTAGFSGCCGRSMISVGMLAQAIETIDSTIALLRPLIEDDSVRAILFVEPSCLSAIKDDWLGLRCRSPIDLRRKLAGKAMLVEDFVDRAWDQHPERAAVESHLVARRVGADPAHTPVLLHGHCHQKALWGVETSARALRRVLGDRLRVLDTGCCGMAGSFGYDADKYELSMRIANLPAAEGGLMPQIAALPEATVAAPGTSCRHQVHDCTGRAARHPVEILAAELLA